MSNIGHNIIPRNSIIANLQTEVWAVLDHQAWQANNPHKHTSFPDSSVGKESSYNAGDPSLIPGSWRFPEEGIGYPLQYSWAFLVAQLVNNSPAMQRPGFDPWVGKICWRRKGYPLQYSGLENSMDCITHVASKTQTWLSNFHVIDSKSYIILSINSNSIHQTI